MERLFRYNYEEAERYLLGVPRFTEKSAPEDTQEFYRLLGSPGSRQKIIHVAGTNGKGSVCSYLSSLLSECGLSAGMFTSPHLVSMTERIRINGSRIRPEEFADCFNRVCQAIEKSRHHPTFFELLFFMAMLRFEESGTDYIILETGLGGRLDATNCIEHSVVSIITDIGLDHMEYLGNTVELIAGEKAGIIKKGCPVVCHAEPAGAARVIRQKAQEQESGVFVVQPEDVRILEKRKKAIAFSYKSGYYDYISLIVSTDALYQVRNAALAVRALEVVLPRETLTEERIRGALEAARWEGRMEEVLPEVYVDGAHNEDGVRALLESVRADGWPGRRTLLFAAVEDKRYEGMLSRLLESGLFEKTAVTGLGTQRSVSAEALYGILKAHPQVCGVCCESVESAFDKLRKEQQADERIYAAGSLYLVGQIKALLSKEGSE